MKKMFLILFILCSFFLYDNVHAVEYSAEALINYALEQGEDLSNMVVFESEGSNITYKIIK